MKITTCFSCIVIILVLLMCATEAPAYKLGKTKGGIIIRWAASDIPVQYRINDTYSDCPAGDTAIEKPPLPPGTAIDATTCLVATWTTVMAPSWLPTYAVAPSVLSTTPNARFPTSMSDPGVIPSHRVAEPNTVHNV